MHGVSRRDMNSMITVDWDLMSEYFPSIWSPQSDYH